MEIARDVLLMAMVLVSIIAGAGCVVLGWWLAVITMKSEYVPLPIQRSLLKRAGGLKQPDEGEKLIAETYDDVLDDR